MEQGDGVVLHRGNLYILTTIGETAEHEVRVFAGATFECNIAGQPFRKILYRLELRPLHVNLHRIAILVLIIQKQNRLLPH